MADAKLEDKKDVKQLAKPPKEVLENLDLLLNMEVLSDEENWTLLRDLDEIPPATAQTPEVDKAQKAAATPREVDHER